jgi:hypothetical protein
MIRLEIIANHSVEENILDALAHEKAGGHYSKFSGVFGAGRSGPRMGDAVWPEENFALVIWCELEEAAAIERAIVSVKRSYPNEGIKLFGLPDPAALQLPYPAAGVSTGPSAALSPAASAADSAGESPAAAPVPQEPPNFGGESF